MKREPISMDVCIDIAVYLDSKNYLRLFIINQKPIIMVKQTILFLGVFLAFSTLFAQPPSVFGEPNFSVNEDVHDFGELEVDGDGSCLFEVTNTGNQPLIISKCEKTCGCTIPVCDPSPILPGKKSEISVSYDTHRIGPFNKSVKIYSNDPDEPMKILRVKGKVVALNDSSPD